MLVNRTAETVRILKIGLSVVALIVWLTACRGPSAYKAPVSRFRDASAAVVESTKVYLAELNKVERDNYIFNQANNDRQIRLNEVERAQVFSKDGIAARLDALDELAGYSDLLYKLANSDMPEKIKGQASDLKSALTNLSSNVSKLSGEDDKQFQGAVSKAIPILSDVLEAYVNQRLENALKKAIQAGDAPVNELITAIENDSEIAYQRRRTQQSSLRVSLIDQYNREFEKGPRGDRTKLRAYAEQISMEEDRWEAFVTSRPSTGLEAMKRANTALVEFAKKPKPQIRDFADLVDTMEWFAATATRVAHAIQALEGNNLS
jgi:hypothetical protein